MQDLRVGDLVEFSGEDSYYKGTIVCIFTKLNGKSVRLIVEDDRGLLLIKGPKQAKLLNRPFSTAILDSRDILKGDF